MLGFKYLLLNPGSLHETHLETFNRVYDLWKQSTPEFSGTDTVTDFQQAQQIGVLLCHREIVGFQLLSHADLRLKSTQESMQDCGLPSTGMEFLRSLKLTRAIRAAQPVIASEWKQRSQEVPWSEILWGLSLRLLDESSADLMITRDLPEMTEKSSAMLSPGEGTVLLFPRENKRRLKSLLTTRWVHLLWPLSDLMPVKTHSVQ